MNFDHGPMIGVIGLCILGVLAYLCAVLALTNIVLFEFSPKTNWGYVILGSYENRRLYTIRLLLLIVVWPILFPFAVTILVLYFLWLPIIKFCIWFNYLDVENESVKHIPEIDNEEECEYEHIIYFRQYE